MVVIFNRVNHNFKEKTKTSQKTGLDVCLDMISNSTGIAHIHISDHNQVFEFLKKNKVKCAIFEALNFDYRGIKQIKEMFGIEAYVHLHSSYPFLSVEPAAARMILNYNKNGIGVIFNSVKAKECFKHSLNECLENIYDCSSLVEPKVFKSEVIDVGCHGSLRHMKNIPLQAIAAIRYADQERLKIRFHVNDRNEGDGAAISAILKAIFEDTKHELIFDGWMTHDKFKKHCSTLDLGMQLSVSETFNLVAADYVSSGLPCVFSDQIEWADDLSKCRYDSVSEICERIKIVLNNPVLVKRNQELLKRHSDQSTIGWIGFKERFC